MCRVLASSAAAAIATHRSSSDALTSAAAVSGSAAAVRPHGPHALGGLPLPNPGSIIAAACCSCGGGGGGGVQPGAVIRRRPSRVPARPPRGGLDRAACALPVTLTLRHDARSRAPARPGERSRARAEVLSCQSPRSHARKRIPFVQFETARSSLARHPSLGGLAPGSLTGSASRRCRRRAPSGADASLRLHHAQVRGWRRRCAAIGVRGPHARTTRAADQVHGDADEGARRPLDRLPTLLRRCSPGRRVPTPSNCNTTHAHSTRRTKTTRRRGSRGQRTERQRRRDEDGSTAARSRRGGRRGRRGRAVRVVGLRLAAETAGLGDAVDR